MHCISAITRSSLRSSEDKSGFDHVFTVKLNGENQKECARSHRVFPIFYDLSLFLWCFAPQMSIKKRATGALFR
jgi:hypothetical protein